MTLGSTHAIALAGLEGRLVEVEAHLSNALPGLIVSGLPDAACRQAPERIRAAAESSGLPLPSRKIVVNLSPAALPKNGTGFDLAIAVAILAAMEVIPHRHVREVVHLGELGLDGAVRPVAGVLPSVVAALRA
ncbi:MAG: magnesium chelatase domain-containing protein, partial [Nostocoides sp.]